MTLKSLPGVVFVILLLLPAAYLPAQTLTTWNVRILSDKSRDDSELDKIASIIEQSDFVALQEVRDSRVLARLMDRLEGWDYILSLPAGRGVKEFYAYLYRTELFEVLGAPYSLNDYEDLFIREPYIAHFRCGTFDFTIVTMHSIYGDKKALRRAEAALLDDVIAYVDEENGPEADVILTGDFNLPGDDGAWEMEPYRYLVPSDVKTTISDASSYDNIWISTATTEVMTDISLYAFDEILFGNDDKTASREVSDHRPVSIEIRSNLPDDDEEGDWDYPDRLIPSLRIE
ncbi:MAG: endonuclease/exonuclease/phosphatase family protein [Spirochaetales bacterium]|nr:endonuclease/exonuclease/phosphatase family protein [Spirochaetales bacterium]